MNKESSKGAVKKGKPPGKKPAGKRKGPEPAAAQADGLHVKLAAMEDFLHAYDAWAHSPEHCGLADPLFAAMLEARDALDEALHGITDGIAEAKEPVQPSGAGSPRAPGDDTEVSVRFRRANLQAMIHGVVLGVDSLTHEEIRLRLVPEADDIYSIQVETNMLVAAMATPEPVNVEPVKNPEE